MIRDNDSRNASLGCEPGIFDALNSFNQNGPLPVLLKPFDVFPGNAGIKLVFEVLTERDRVVSVSDRFSDDVGKQDGLGANKSPGP